MTPRFISPLIGSYERASEPFRTANDTSYEVIPAGFSCNTALTPFNHMQGLASRIILVYKTPMNEYTKSIQAWSRRKKQMQALRNQGFSDAKIGMKFGGISHQRVGQILGPKKARKV